jgi:beta-lactamase class A
VYKRQFKDRRHGRRPRRKLQVWQAARALVRRRLLALATLLVLAFCLVGGLAVVTQSPGKPTVRTVVPPNAERPPELAPPVEVQPEQTHQEQRRAGSRSTAEDLEARIREIAEHHGGDYGVIVLDPDSGRKVSLEGEKTFFAASLGKLPTLISLYKSAERGEVNLDAEISIRSSDVQGYGTGVLHDYPVGATMTLRECAHYLMNVSDNTAWAMLTRYLGIDKIQADLDAIGAYRTEYWAPNTTTPEDVLLMLRRAADPSFTSRESSEEMLAAMTDTAFEDRLAGGLPADVRVAHKIGSYESSFSDAGIVFYEDGDGVERHYYIVVIAENVGEATARSAMQDMARAAHEALAKQAE